MSSDIVDRITAHVPSHRAKNRKLSGTAQFWLIFRYISLFFILALVILPIYVLVVNSFKGTSVFLEDALKIRTAVHLPLIFVGGLKSIGVIENILEKGFDFVQFARALIHDPAFIFRFGLE